MPATQRGAVRTRLNAWMLASILTLVAVPAATAATVSVTLYWTAPGDDGHTGRATTYELRWSSSPINDSNVLMAARFLGLGQPSMAGQRDSMRVTIPVSGGPLYFALRTADEAGNWSLVSNNATLPGTTAELPDSLGGLVLARPVPNPAKQSTMVTFTTPRDTDARVDVFDTSGRRVRALVDGRLERGRHALRWDLLDDRRGSVPTGLYLVRARVGAWEGIQRVAVVR